MTDSKQRGHSSKVGWEKLFGDVERVGSRLGWVVAVLGVALFAVLLTLGATYGEPVGPSDADMLRHAAFGAWTLAAVVLVAAVMFGRRIRKCLDTAAARALFTDVQHLVDFGVGFVVAGASLQLVSWRDDVASTVLTVYVPLAAVVLLRPFLERVEWAGLFWFWNRGVGTVMPPLWRRRAGGHEPPESAANVVPVSDGDGHASGHGAARTVFDWARRVAALAIVGAGVVMLNSGHLDTCTRAKTAQKVVSSTCHRPSIDDPVVLGTVLFVLLLLAPDLSEFSVAGVATMKLRLRTQEARSDALDAEVRALRIEVTTATASSAANANQQQIVNVTPGTGTQSAVAMGSVDPTPADSDTADEQATEPAAQSDTDSADFLGQARALAADLALRAVLDTAARETAEIYGLDVVRPHLYPPNDAGLLLPADDPDRPSDDAGWPPGAGAVGTVWQTGVAEARHGEETQTGLGDLPEDRRKRYASTQLVLAVPVEDVDGRIIGILSASCDQVADADCDRAALLVLETYAQASSRIVVDLLGWYTDRPMS